MKTLIITDIQNDFIPGGALEVPGGDEIVSVINGLQDKFDLVVATQDWHPANHISFASNHPGKKSFEVIEWHGMEQILWPDHCVQNSGGAAFHPALRMERVEAIFRKGMDKEIDSYSGFYDNGHKKNTGLAGYLRGREADDLYFCGLAADFCVYYSIRDAMKEGFKTTLIEDATRPIDADKFKEIKTEISSKGCVIISSRDIPWQGSALK
ncbi:MAG: bifunctional nicotinamidase/pyrazinamidase [Bacteroidales bacterium]|nr:bifunctional nicotinamidase/pyrazinamidase [Bacteroidales bacterium]